MVPQAIHCWKSKSTKDISLSAFLLMALGSTLWFTYGVLQKDVIIYSANLIVGSMAIVILIAKLRYK
jgi:MtN3 and saliva related transmembrane protein